MVSKAEALVQGHNTRFVVPTSEADPLSVYDHSVDWGEPEQWIDQFRNTCFADRLSCCAFWANQFRLSPAAATYWLLGGGPFGSGSGLHCASVSPMRMEHCV